MPITTFQGVIANQPSILVNARELHTRLQIGKDFSTWIKDRITNYGFQEGLDFSPILGKSKGLFGRPAVEYHITLDMAKELCMLERSELGQKARRYFIQMEKKHCKPAKLPYLPQLHSQTIFRLVKINTSPCWKGW
ncbi:antA/AntB antirepressor family protein [Glaesserella parasuis]|uniref:antA/AntB antirepressor family protein n=1 Tax=Glaesserella parasuis TaxID=738 RepID=UPI001F477BD7|nr:antA/AntB antirepressor family protein [Glaesserella parasuis]MDE3972082.1 antA/AntB antirepressor family protein [Glaesserella parasuis]MDE3999447.1 antA/AntB antirepressor family protein [Glaesserella parasuis]MDG6828289.1 antA/AntB antirepressor family protein [Glaesserella parasuis]MDP0017768.1 antA/AntB antirepressor family protein [Glaesserella parasuis]MDP0111096.1 antA/AntB antirepressor family protein [Glaesserella parasuis]